MPEVEGSVVISRPVEDVFAYVSDPQNDTKWQTGMIVSEFTSEGGPRVGAKGRSVEKIWGTEESTWELTEYEQNKAFAMSFESPRFTGHGGWRFESADGGTRLTYRYQAEPRGLLWKALMPLMVAFFRRQIRGDYAKLKGLLESGA